MNFQYINNNSINPGQLYNMDYLSLVNMLTLQLTPIDRKVILDRLVEMNDQLLYKKDMNIDLSRNSQLYSAKKDMNIDLSRNSQLNSRKKDIKENLHPSMDFYNHSKKNPLPLNIPSSSTSQSSIETRNVFYNPNPYGDNHSGLQKKSYSDEIDLDSIINNISDFDDEENNKESLDDKLKKIKKLHSKIITNNKQKRKK
uniref:Uncharacterized protein n=1 Tax=Borely moumouvirus TaxID=2712067 RepID=A0A6G6AC22_9VIRU